MNKIYILFALGLSASVQADSISDSVSVRGASASASPAGFYGDSTPTKGSFGWYAGDCLDPKDFSLSYGFVDFDCGD